MEVTLELEGRQRSNYHERLADCRISELGDLVGLLRCVKYGELCHIDSF